jgi:hypothetical protein
LVAPHGCRRSRSPSNQFTQPNQHDLAGPAIGRKIIRFSFSPNQTYKATVPLLHEGRFAIVTNVERDAMDADSADDERHLRRTAKSCGSDASTLASNRRQCSRIALMTVTTKPDHREEHEGNR